MNLLNQIKKYDLMDWPIFPVKGKEPLVKWREYEFGGDYWPENATGIGLKLGKVSGMCVLDCDGPNALLKLRGLKFNSPAFSITGRGRHLFFKWQEGINNAQDIFNQRQTAGDQGVDIRGEGGYVVIPPSIHPSGVIYRWGNNIPPKADSLPLFPLQLIGRQIEPSSKTDEKLVADWVAICLSSQPKQRRVTLLRLLGRLRQDSYSKEAMRLLLLPYVEKWGVELSEFERLLNDVQKYSIDIETQEDSEDAIKIWTKENSLSEYNERKANTKRLEFCTGFLKLDALLQGFRRKNIAVIAGRPGVGKTAIACAITNKWANEGKNVLYFSTEMTFDELQDRGYYFPICEKERPTLEYIERAITQIMPDIFVFDNFNVISEEPKELAHFMKGLKSLARKFNIPCLLLVQLNRGAEQFNPRTGHKVRPRLSHLKGTSAVESFGAQIILCDKDQDHQDGFFFTAYFEKARFGRLGEVKFELQYSPFKIKEL